MGVIPFVLRIYNKVRRFLIANAHKKTFIVTTSLILTIIIVVPLLIVAPQNRQKQQQIKMEQQQGKEKNSSSQKQSSQNSQTMKVYSTGCADSKAECNPTTFTCCSGQCAPDATSSIGFRCPDSTGSLKNCGASYNASACQQSCTDTNKTCYDTGQKSSGGVELYACCDKPSTAVDCVQKTCDLYGYTCGTWPKWVGKDCTDEQKNATVTCTPGCGIGYTCMNGSCYVDGTSPSEPVNGICGLALNTCSNGTFSDTANTTTEYKWDCLGKNKGTDDHCTQAIPKESGQCDDLDPNKGPYLCLKGTVSDKNDLDYVYSWKCLGTGGGDTASCTMSKKSNKYKCNSSNECVPAADSDSGTLYTTQNCGGNCCAKKDANCVNGFQCCSGVCTSGKCAASIPFCTATTGSNDYACVAKTDTCANEDLSKTCNDSAKKCCNYTCSGTGYKCVTSGTACDTGWSKDTTKTCQTGNCCHQDSTSVIHYKCGADNKCTACVATDNCTEDQNSCTAALNEKNCPATAATLYKCVSNKCTACVATDNCTTNEPGCTTDQDSCQLGVAGNTTGDCPIGKASDGNTYSCAPSCPTPNNPKEGEDYKHTCSNDSSGKLQHCCYSNTLSNAPTCVDANSYCIDWDQFACPVDTAASDKTCNDKNDTCCTYSSGSGCETGSTKYDILKQYCPTNFSSFTITPGSEYNCCKGQPQDIASATCSNGSPFNTRFFTCDGSKTSSSAPSINGISCCTCSDGTNNCIKPIGGTTPTKDDCPNGYTGYDISKYQCISYSIPSKTTGVYCCINQNGTEKVSPLTQVSGGGENKISASLPITIGLDGLGAAGDYSLPCYSLSGCGSNKNPLTSQRKLTVSILNSNNSNKASATTTVSYDTATGMFKGAASVNVAAGTYKIKVKSPGFLTKTLEVSQSLAAGTNAVSSANLVNGDIDNDNSLSVLDYNILISCSKYSNDSHALCNKNADYKKLSDLNDNGIVDEVDYNLFLREYPVQNGD
jgi:hypothetical protein